MQMFRVYDLLVLVIQQNCGNTHRFISTEAGLLHSIPPIPYKACNSEYNICMTIRAKEHLLKHLPNRLCVLGEKALAP